MLTSDLTLSLNITCSVLLYNDILNSNNELVSIGTLSMVANLTCDMSIQNGEFVLDDVSGVCESWLLVLFEICVFRVVAFIVIVLYSYVPDGC